MSTTTMEDYTKWVQSRLREHDTWVNKERPIWAEARAFYEDDAYRHNDDTDKEGHKRVRFQVNRIRGWVTSFVASLFFRGARTQVQPGEAQVDLDPIEKGVNPSTAMALLFDRFLATEMAEELTEQAFRMGMLYPHAAIKIGEDVEQEDPLHALWLYVAPVYEVFWDRETQGHGNHRWKAHTYDESIEVLKQRFPKAEGLISGAEAVTRQDAIEDGLGKDRHRRGTSHIPGDKSFLRVLEFWDLERDFKGEKGEAVPGYYTAWIVADDKLKRIFEGPIAMADIDGKPLDDVTEIIMEPRPDKPLWGLSPVATLMENNREENYHRTTLARGARKDAGRTLVARKGVLSEQNMARFVQGEDLELIEYEGDELPNQIVGTVQISPMPRTTLDVLGLLDKEREQTQGTTPLSRGQALDYASATEVQSLNQYTETTLGMFRNRMDKSMSRLLRRYQRRLAMAMDDREVKEVRVRHGEKVVTIKREWLNVRWKIALRDLAATPQAEATKRLEFAQAQPILQGSVELAFTPDELDPTKPALVAIFAREVIDYMVELYGLPEAFRFDRLEARRTATEMPEPPPPPEPPPVEALPPGALPPGELPPGALPVEAGGAAGALGDINDAIEVGTGGQPGALPPI